VMVGFPDDSIDLVVTSPPYWGLRDYGSEPQIWGGKPDCEHEWGESLPAAKSGHKNIGFEERSKQDYRGGGHKPAIAAEQHFPSEAGQFCSKCGAWIGSLGLEPHPQIFIDHLVDICREIKRVLKPSGTFWLNLGDTYCSSGKWVNKELDDIGKQNRSVEGGSIDPYSMRGKLKPDGGWIQPKQLLMMPARIAIALQHDGWILRNDIIWFKPNHMPSSVRDRLTNAYEHVFLLVKNRRYYFDLDAIRKPFSEGTFLRIEQPNIDNQPGGPKTAALRGESPESGNASRPIDMARELSHKVARGERIGKNPGDVWDIEDEELTKHDRAVDRTYRSYTDPLHAKEYHPMGKNPGDIWEIDTPNTGARNRPPYKQNALYGDTPGNGNRPDDILEGLAEKYDTKFDETTQYNQYQQRMAQARREGKPHDNALGNPKGKNPGDLWRIPTTPFPGTHFATFPPNLIEPIIRAGCPRWICSECGQPRTRITKPSPEYAKKLGRSVHDHVDDLKLGMRYDKVCNAEYVTVGWSTCSCGGDWVPGVVLDPFAGSGTALRVARRLGRYFIGIEINPEYAEMCNRRVRTDSYTPPPEGVRTLTEIFEDTMSDGASSGQPLGCTEMLPDEEVPTKLNDRKRLK
jgi:DNA modification methylase